LVLVAQSSSGITAVLLGDDRDALRRDLQERFPEVMLTEDGEKLNAIAGSVIALVESPARGLDLPLDLRVDVVEYLGGTRYVYASYESDRQVIIEDRGTGDIPPGQVRDFPVDISKALYFTPDGVRLRARV
jgi:hypothetical protein